LETKKYRSTPAPRAARLTTAIALSASLFHAELVHAQTASPNEASPSDRAPSAPAPSEPTQVAPQPTPSPTPIAPHPGQPPEPLPPYTPLPSEPLPPPEPTSETPVSPAAPPSSADAGVGGPEPGQSAEPVTNQAVEPEDSAAASVQAGDTSEQERSDELGSVIVTASKREERAQDVPAAITTVGQQQILDLGLTASTDVERASPNVSAQASGSRSSRPRWFLRGIGTNDPSVNLESPNGIYQDEVFIAYGPLQTFPLFDLERVEILKGPQGTLWGKNTTGGAIHFVSRKPSFTTISGYARATIGSYGTRGIEAAVGGPVWGEWLAARAAFSYEQQEGWAKNLLTGSKDPQFNDLATRLTLSANITNDLDVQLIGRLRLLSGGVQVVYPVGALPGGEIRQYPNAPATYTPPYGKHPSPGDSFYRGPVPSQVQDQNITGTANYHFGDYTLTSITNAGYATNEAVAYAAWPVPTFDQTATATDVRSKQITQEVRFTSPREDRFNWILGFNYFYWDLDSDAANGLLGPVATRKSLVINRYSQVNKAYAGFASAKLNIFQGLSLGGGVRYTYDHKDVRATRLNGSGAELNFTNPSLWYDPDTIGSPLNNVTLRADKGWSRVTGDVTPEWQITPDHLLYFKFAKGFRAGTFNPAILPAIANRPTSLPRVDPEELLDFEFGAKTAWFGRRLIANVSAFYYLLDDVQLNVQQPNPMGTPGANTSAIQNAAGGTIKGLELELEGLPVDLLRLRGSLGIVDAKYTDFITYQGAETIDGSGNRFYRTPLATGVLAAELRIPLVAEHALGVGTDWTVRSRIYHNAVVQDDKQQQTEPYAIGNVELRYLLGEHFQIQGFVRNVLDDNIKVLSQVVNAGAYPTSLAPPRTYGVQIIAEL
jgi:iron complex outermembrane recepter protein